MEIIKFYSTNKIYGWMSNFAQYGVTIDNIYYPTNEHFYQSQKSLDPKDQEFIRTAPKAYQAKHRGSEIQIRPDWENVKIGIMRVGLLAKINQHLVLRTKLLATGEALLIEDSPSDYYWGIGNGSGQNMMGKLWMEIRESLKSKP